MRPIVIEDFLDEVTYDLLYNSCLISEPSAVDESDSTYKLKRYIFDDSNEYLHDEIIKVVLPHIYDNFAFQFTQYPYTHRTSFVYRNMESDFDPKYHSDMKGGDFNGAFMNAIIYFNKGDDWSGGEFGYKDYELNNMIKPKDNMCIIIPAGLRHKIYPVTHGVRRSINLEFKIIL